MRCGFAVKYAVVKSLEGRQRPVQLFEMYEAQGSFELRRPVDLDELSVSLLRRAREYIDASKGI